MPRKAAGNVTRTKSGALSARFSVGPKTRKAKTLVACKTQEEADERARRIAKLVRAMRKAGHDGAALLDMLDEAARADAATMLEIEKDAAELCKRPAAPKPKPRANDSPTFEAFATSWCKGELHKKWPDHVRTPLSADKILGALKKHAFPSIGPVPMSEFTLDTAERLLREIAPTLASATRRLVCVYVRRVVQLAVYPGKHLADNPIRKGWLPQVGASKALGFLYPSEDSALLVCRDVPLAMRVWYGFLAREGMRCEESTALGWQDFDLARGVVRLDRNKTNDPRMWKLGADVVRALTEWKRIQPTNPVFPIIMPHHNNLALRFREHLLEAEVTRPELHEESETRRPIRIHDLRATFVTLALASGRSDTYVRDRTGHKSSYMVGRYHRQARTAAELDLGWLAPLDRAIPEFSPEAERTTEQASQLPNELPTPTPAARPPDTKPRYRRGRSSRRGSWRGTAGGATSGVSESGELHNPRGAQNAAGDRSALNRRPIANELAMPNSGAEAAPDHRQALVVALSDALRDAALAGDVEAVKVATEALTRLVGAASGGAGAVVDLAARRRR